MIFTEFIILFILGFATIIGFSFGLIRTLGSFVIIVASFIVSGFLFHPLGSILEPFLFHEQNFSRMIAFLLIYWIVSSFLACALNIVNKLFNLTILKTVNRILGGAVALFGSVLILSTLFFIVNELAWIDEIQELLHQSIMINYLIIIGKYTSFLIPGI